MTQSLFSSYKKHIYLQSTPELLGIRNLANDWNPKTRNPESVIWNSEPTLRNPESKTAHAIPSILGKIKARSGAEWVIKFGYPCIQEILVVTKSSVRTSF